MLLSTVRKCTVPAALTLALWVLASPAHALAIVSRWDPLINAAFGGVTWSGTAQFDVPDACVASNFSGVISNNSIANCQIGNIAVNPNIGATVNFAGSGGGTLHWRVDSGDGLDLDDVPQITSMTFTNGIITGMTTGLSEYFRVQGGSGLVSNFGWALSFSSLGNGLITAGLTYATCESFNREGEGVRCRRVGTNDTTQFPAILRGQYFVPEPQTNALIVAGIAAIGFVGRRRRRI